MNQYKKQSFKYFYNFLIILAILFMSFFSFTSVASASTLENEDIGSDETLILETHYIDGVGLTQEEIQEELEKQTETTASPLNNNSFSTFAASPTVLTASIIRISSDIHQLYLNYSGSATINSFRIRNLTISNTNLLFPEQYHSESYIFKSTGGRASGSQYLSTFTAPASVKKFKVKMGSVEAYYHALGWRPGVVNNGTVTVK